MHGAWHGGWCWQRVTPLLTRAGHRVLTPTLTGLGDRAHLARRDIDVELHARDLEAVFEMEDLRDVVLVGHSYAGMPMSLLAERLPERLAGVVYFDAFVPESGKSVIDYIQPPERREALIRSGRETGFAAPVRNAPGWRLHELPSGHDAMIIDAPLVAELLLPVAREL